MSKMNEKQKVWFVLPLRSLLFVAVFFICSGISRKSLMDITHWWSVIASAVNLATIVVLWGLCKRDNITYRKLVHYEKRERNVLKGFVFVFSMLLTAMAGMYLAGWFCYGVFPYLAPMMIAPISPYLALLNLLILPITTTIAEEGVYLGCGVNSFDSKWTAVLLPAFFYALQHSFIPTMMDSRFVIYRFLSFLPLTIWICHQYRKRKGCIAYIMTGHWFLNIATTIQIAIMSFHPEVYGVMIRQ